MVLALNMMDEVRENGGYVHINELESALGIPVVPISAAKNEGIDELISHALHVARYQERPGRMDFCQEDEEGGAVHRCIHSIMHLIEDHAKKAEIPVRFAACKVIEGDNLILDSLKLNEKEKDMLENIITHMEEERGLDRAAAIADMRFGFIKRICKETVEKPTESKEHVRSRKLDAFLTGKYTAIPAFIGIMVVVFWLTFNVIGAWLQGLLETGIGALTELVDESLTSWHVNEVLYSLVIDGIFNGVGSVLSFLPIIVTLFFFLSILEDSGYTARIAFVMELPNYRMPGAKNVAHLLWDKAKDFLQRAFTIIFLATIAIWFLQTFDIHMNVVSDSKESLLAIVAGVIAPVFAPLGLGDWRISTALISGVMAKESVVSTVTVLFGSTEALVAVISPVAAISLLVFCLLYTPCIAAISSIKRELGGKWAVGVAFGQCFIAWIVAFAVYLIGGGMNI